MAYDEGLAERVRGVFDGRAEFSEKRMFGGIAFMIAGHMCVGVVKDELMVRVGPSAYAELVRAPHARRMDFTGRPLTGFVYVEPDGLEHDRDLERWVEHALRFARSLPPKSGPPRARGVRGGGAGRPRRSRA